MNLTADGQTVMENRYQYDAVDNILGITNAANPTSLTKLNKAKLGGRSSHTYEYDELNRLIHASGKAKRASYDMVMSFGRMSEPLTKVQKVDSTTTAKSYNFAYKYEDSNHPTAPTQIGHDHYTYDANGNPVLVTNDSTNTTREMYWDEDNRLMVLSDNGKTSRYTYNAAGERIMKSYGTMEGVYINGAPQGITFHETDNFTLYPASILSVNKNRFTKHYFIGDKRIASRIGTGMFNNVYGRNGSYVTAGQQDYAERMNQIQTQKEAYYKKVGVAPGVPTEKGAYGDPENTGVGYNAVLTELGNHDVPQGWIQTPRPNTTPGTNPGPPVSWNDPSNPDDPQAGYGYIPNDTTKEETFFYHSDHLGSTSYITDDKANITQYDAYLPYGELLVDEHSSSENMPYKFNGKEMDEETGLYYYGARYLNPVTSLWYGVDPLAEKYQATSGYLYALGNPIRLVDPNGEASGPWDWLFGPKPWIKRNSLISYAGNGVFKLNISNFSNSFQQRLHNANNNPQNWSYRTDVLGNRVQDVGIDLTIATISQRSNSDRQTSMAKRFNHSQYKNKPIGFNTGDGKISSKAVIAKSTGLPDKRVGPHPPIGTMSARAGTVGGVFLALNFAITAIDTYQTYTNYYDYTNLEYQSSLLRTAGNLVNRNANILPKQYQNDTNFFGAVVNYVFQGINALRNRDVEHYGNMILKSINRYDYRQNRPIPLVRY